MQTVERLAAVRYTNEDRLADELPGTEVLFAWNARPAAIAMAWPKADALRWVHVAGGSVAKLPPAVAVTGDVVVTNSRGLFDEPIAEYVLGLVLAFAKDLPGRMRLQAGRTWRQRETERVTGKRALVAGTGSIGRAIGRKLACAGMLITGIGRVGRASDPDLGQVLPFDRLTEALRQTDYLVLAAPLTDDTRGMVDARAFAAMSPTTRVINVSRAGLIVQEDLVNALRGGQIAGAALDVFPNERLDPASPLWELPQLLISPHMSGQVIGWREELVELFADNLTRFIEGKALRNAMNRPRSNG